MDRPSRRFVRTWAATVVLCASLHPSAGAQPAPKTFVLADPGAEVYYRFAAVAGERLFAAGIDVTGDLHSNGDVALQPGTTVVGTVSAAGRVQIRGAVVGDVVKADPRPLPALGEDALRAAADRILPGGSTIEDARIEDVVFVEGDLRITGSLTGQGTLIALGDVHFLPAPPAGSPAPRDDEADQLSIVAFGDIRLDPGRSLRGTLYAGRDLIGDRSLTVDGVLVAGRRLLLEPGTRLRFEDFDVEPPRIEISSPAPDELLPTVSPLVAARITDDLSGVRDGSLRLEIDEVDRTPETEISGADRDLRLELRPDPGLADGSHTLRIRAVDRSDNEATAERAFVTDTVPPSLVIVSPASDPVVGPLATVELAYTDATSGVDLESLEVRLDGADRTGTCTAGPASATCPADDLAAGPHDLEAALADRAGNVTTASLSFELVLDTAPPSPRVDPPVSPTASQVVTLTGQARPGSRIEVAGGVEPVLTSTAPDGTFSAQVSLAPNTLNRLFVAAIAGDQRSAPTAVQILQDGEPPVLAVDLPTDGAEVLEDQISVSGRVSDRLSGFLGVDVSVDGDPARVDTGIGTNGTFHRAAVPLVPGTNVLEVTAVDHVGNRTTRTVRVERVDPPGPRLLAVSGDEQRATVGNLLAAPLVVRLLQDDGSPLAGKVVTFEVSRSDGRLRLPGSADPEAIRLQTLTDALGEASVEWRLGSDAGCGNHRVTVRSAGVAGTPVFTASADPGPPRLILVGSGNEQIAEAGAPTPEPLRVWVNDGRNGLAGVPVTFAVTVGGGLVDGGPEATVLTDLTGHATVDFTLGDRAGEQRVEAAFRDHDGLPATFVVHARKRSPGTSTSFSGLVVDNAGRPLGGATCRLEVDGIELPATLSDSEGRFRFPDVPAGPGHLTVDGLTVTTTAGVSVPPASFPELGYEAVLVPEAENSLPRPVRLPPLVAANARTYDGTEDVVLGIEGVEGLQMTIRAGSMRLSDGTVPSPEAPVTVSLNQVHFDDLPMPMPDGAAPPVAWTLQPAGSTFDPPVEIRLPNMAGLPAGATMYFLSFDHDIGRFQIVATGRVSDDGSEMVSDPGSGIVKAGWGGFTPPYPNTGDVKVDTLGEAKDVMRKDVQDREGTASVALARQILCLAERACDPEARETWGSGFVSKVLQDIAEHRANGESPADRVCRHIPSWVDLGLETPTIPNLPPEVAKDLKVGVNEACAMAGGFYHFKDELEPGFERHMKEQLDAGGSKVEIRSQHEGLLDQVASCFSTIPELSLLAQKAAGLLVPPIARFFRERTLDKLCFQPSQAFARPKAAALPDVEELFVPDLELLSELHVSAPNDAFVLPVGSQLQLRVLTQDGVDLAADLDTEYFLAVGDDNVTLGPGGFLSVLGTPQPQAGVPALFQVYVHNGDLFGVGQFAVVDVDTDGDLAVDSAEIRAGLDPLVFNGPDDDLDGDGLDDVTELFVGTDPHLADTDSDGIPDSDELTVGSDPGDPNSNTPPLGAGAQVDVAGRTTFTRADGSFQLRNLPTSLNPVRVIARMELAGQTFYGVSDYVDIVDQGVLRLPEILMTPALPSITVSLSVATATPILNAVGATTQLTAEAVLSDGSTANVTGRAQGTAYRSSNPDVAFVDVAGRVTAVSRGRVFLTAFNQGAVAVTQLLVVPGDPLTEVTGFVVHEDGTPADGLTVVLPAQPRETVTGPDGRFSIPDVATQLGEVSVAVESRDPDTGDLLLATGAGLDLVPGGLTDAGILVLRPLDRADQDGDGAPDDLEILLGTDARDPETHDGVLDGRIDSDRDGVADWIEVVLGTDPALGDSDGDGTGDAQEDLDGDGFTDAFEVAARCDWRAREATTVEGRILTPDGLPAAGAEVDLFRTAGVGAPDLDPLTTPTGADGSYRFPDVSVCPLRVQVEAALESGTGSGSRVGSPRVDAAVGTATALPNLRLRSLPEPVYPGRRTLVGRGPRGVAWADLDRDGLLDLLTANSASGDLSVLLGTPGGGFRPQARVPLGPSPHALAVGDLDADGFPDVVVTDEQDDTVRILLAWGDGTFRDPIALHAGDEPVAAVLADLDSDGALDLVIANRGSSTRPFTDGDISVFAGLGDGTFAARVAIPVGSRPTAVTVADADGDGALDLVAAEPSPHDIALVFGQGDGTFGPEQRIPVGTFPSGVAVADLTGDGLADLLVSDGGPDEVVLLAGRGARTFVEERRFPVGENPLAPRVADVTGDGVLDLLTLNSFSDDVSVLAGLGGGELEPEQRLHTGPAPVDFALADLDADGDLDLATANLFSDDVTVLENGGAGFADLSSFPVGGAPRRVVVADLVEDGIPDAVTANLFDGTLSVLPGVEPGTFADPAVFATGNFPADLAVADLDGDGHLDLVTADLIPDTATIYRGAGDGTFLASGQVATGAFPVSVALADLDGDSRLDLLSANGSGASVTVARGNGDGTFQDGQELPAGSFPLELSVGDLDGDGAVDVATNNFNSSSVSLLLSREGFDRQRVIPTGPSPIGLAAGDLDGDGRLDLVVSERGSSQAKAFLGHGGATFEAVPTAPVSDSGVIALRDLNGDGTLDLLVLDENFASLSVYLGIGNGLFAPELRFGVGSFPQGFDVVDVDADGIPDVVVADSGSDDVTVLIEETPREP